MKMPFILPLVLMDLILCLVQTGWCWTTESLMSQSRVWIVFGGEGNLKAGTMLAWCSLDLCFWCEAAFEPQWECFWERTDWSCSVLNCAVWDSVTWSSLLFGRQKVLSKHQFRALFTKDILENVIHPRPARWHVYLLFEVSVSDMAGGPVDPREILKGVEALLGKDGELRSLEGVPKVFRWGTEIKHDLLLVPYDFKLLDS